MLSAPPRGVVPPAAPAVAPPVVPAAARPGAPAGVATGRALPGPRFSWGGLVTIAARPKARTFTRAVKGAY